MSINARPSRQLAALTQIFEVLARGADFFQPVFRLERLPATRAW